MTVALAYRDSKNKVAYIVSDSCASDSLSHSTVKNQKVFHPVGRRDIVFGCAGTFRLPNLLQYIPGIFPPEEELATDDIDLSYLVNEFTPVVRVLVEDFDEEDSWEVLIAVGDRIYRMQMDLSILEPASDCDAIGCGGPVALGAFKILNELEPDMSIEDRMNHALNIACDTVIGCQRPFMSAVTEKIPDEILAKIPKDREKTTGYEIIRCKDNEEDEESIVKKKKKKKKKPL
jgi:hypothetical protein